MAEYIEREALIEDFKSCGADKGLVDAIVYRINQHPAADVEVVRHGKWVDKETCYTCSLCGRVERMKEPYCHCGARMDGKGET